MPRGYFGGGVLGGAAGAGVASFPEVSAGGVRSRFKEGAILGGAAGAEPVVVGVVDGPLLATVSERL